MPVDLKESKLRVEAEEFKPMRTITATVRDNTNVNPPAHEEASTQQCKFLADGTGKASCGSSLEEKCTTCRKINQLLHGKTVELNAAYNAQTGDILKARDEIEQGLLEERRQQLLQERTQGEIKERKAVFMSLLTELQEKLTSAEEKQARLQKEIMKEESIRGELMKTDLVGLRGLGNFAINFTK